MEMKNQKPKSDTKAPKQSRPRRNPSRPAAGSAGGNQSPAVYSATGNLHITLNPQTARQAVILSEIIGRPLAKRRRGR